MTPIRDALVSLDTNEFLFALDQSLSDSSSRRLLFEGLVELSIILPLQVRLEMIRHLGDRRMRQALELLREAREFREEFAPGAEERVEFWNRSGAKSGDVRIIAQLELAEVTCFISENRHFLREIPSLPFRVLTGQEALEELRH